MANLTNEDQFEADISWLADTPLLPGRIYHLRLGDFTTPAAITKLKYRLKSDGSREAANVLRQGEQGICNIALENTLDGFNANGLSLEFELTHDKSNTPTAKGLLKFRLRRSTNIRWQTLTIDKTARALIKHQRPCVIWLTGFSGSGKSTIANLVEKKLHELNKHSYILDGDNVRHGLNKDLGFTDADRVENIRRIAETAKLMVDAGLIVLTSFISPFRSERRMARELMATGEFVEVFVDTPLAVCEQRDPKGLYKKVRAGQIKNFTGFDSPYEAPEQPELSIDTTRASAEHAADIIVEYLQQRD